MTTEHVDARPALASALVTAVDHVGVAVPDLDVAIKWYHDHLGMIVLHEEINEEQGVREAMLSVRGAPKGSAQIQLMAPLDETSTIAKFIGKRGPGIQQLAYRVSDVEALSERLRAQGVRLLYDAPRRGTSNSRINFIHPKDAGGVLIELVEPAADAEH
jgi:methylmalonyl-CoA/ethylmalonyl-CoA epimerase